MNWKATSAWVSTLVMLSAALVGITAVSGAAAAQPLSCNVVVHGENIAGNALQSAINSAAPGQTICIGPGTYDEQITIKTPGLHLVGAGASVTVIAPTTGVENTVDWDSAPTPHAPISTLDPLEAVVLVDNVSGVILKGLTVNAAGPSASITGCQPGVVGVDFQNVTSGTLENSVVKNAELAPALLGCQFQTDVYAYTGYYDTATILGSETVTIQHTTMTAFGKGGVVCDDPALTCNLWHDTVTGIGPTPAIAANGVQIAFGATGMVAYVQVSGNDYTGATATNDFYGSGYSSSGILLYLAGPGTTIENSKITNNQIGILAVGDSQDFILSNHITNSNAYGIVEYGTPTAIVEITGNTVANPVTKSIGIFVANGTFYLTGNKVTWAEDSGQQGASQAVTGPGTVYPTAPAANIATAAVQAVSDGGPTTVYEVGNIVKHSSASLSTLSAFGGSVTIYP